MAFVKLDTGILDSTLWVSREPREVFITALLMAKPFEILDPMPQLHVRSIEETGFVVPPGWYGFIEASGPGIVRRAGLPAEDGLDALKALGDPDPESRSRDFEGRRLVRVDGGFLVLNFMKYRDKDNTAAVRAQRYRDRKKIEASRSSVSVTRNSSCGVTIAEEEAEEEKEESAQSVPRPNARALEDEGKPAISPAGAACLAMRKAGMAATNPGDPRLLELIRQGATVEEFAGAAADAVKAEKGFAWALKALEGRRADASRISLVPAAPLPPWQDVWSEVVRRGAAVGMPWSELTPDGRAASRDRYRSAVVAAWNQKGAEA